MGKSTGHVATRPCLAVVKAYTGIEKKVKPTNKPFPSDPLFSPLELFPILWHIV
jgi:hypothetical protein